MPIDNNVATFTILLPKKKYCIIYLNFWPQIVLAQQVPQNHMVKIKSLQFINIGSLLPPMENDNVILKAHLIEKVKLQS